jgi:BlaI family transcriptional regulator, penicillinase repressor
VPEQPFRVSPAELEVLQVLWEQKTAALGQIHEPLADRYAYTTVQTLLDRLVAKGVVSRDKSRRPAMHRAKVTRRKVAGQYLDLLVDRVCDGPAPLVMQLLERRSFTSDELDEMRRLIDQAEQNDTPDREGASDDRKQ